MDEQAVDINGIMSEIGKTAGSFATRSAFLAGRVSYLEGERLRRYQMLAQIVKSDQMSHADVQRLLMSDPEFAAWYKEHAILKEGAVNGWTP